MPDRRNHPRFRLWLPARLEAGGDVRLAVGHDMSQGGSLLVTSRALDVGARVKLVFTIPPNEGTELALEGEVLRCESNAQDPDGLWPYQIALAFERMAPELENLLREHSAVVEGVAEASEQNGRS